MRGGTVPVKEHFLRGGPTVRLKFDRKSGSHINLITASEI